MRKRIAINRGFCRHKVEAFKFAWHFFNKNTLQIYDRVQSLPVHSRASPKVIFGIYTII